MSLYEARYQQILTAARDRNGDADVDTMVVAAHLAQMRLFMVRQGLEFYATQDSFNQRREFLRKVVDFNELLGRFDAIIDSFLVDGRGLVFFRPAGELYRISYYTKDQYRAYYDEDGYLEELEIIYSYEARSELGNELAVAQGGPVLPGTAQPGGSLRWVKLTVRAATVIKEEGAAMPSFGRSPYGGSSAGNPQNESPNPFGFVPAVEVFNNRGLRAGEGRGEFDWLASYILQHDKMLRAIRGNINFFGNPTLVSSRPMHDLVVADDDEMGATGRRRVTVAAKSGFSSGAQGAITERINGYGQNLRIPRIIPNVEGTDRVAFITPDAVSGDQTLYAQQYQEMIRSALGGVDDLSISSGATAYEVRTLYGRVAATATRKNRELLTYGFCRVFSMMLQHEEYLFRESLASALGYNKPVAPTVDGLTPEQQESLQQRYEKELSAWRQKVGDAVARIKNREEEIPDGVVGLIPDGSTHIDWRWTGQVFEDSPQDILNNSIVCRNLQELGVSSIEALQFLFPQKTPEERAGMLTGYPFRMVEATQRSAGIFVDLARAMFQTPHPAEPDYPLAADPQLDLVPYLYRTLDHLRRELSYSGSYSDVDTASIPPTLSDADRDRIARGDSSELDAERRKRRLAAAADVFRRSGGGAGQLPFFSGGLAAGQPAAGGGPGGTSHPFGTGGVGGTLAFDPADPGAVAASSATSVDAAAGIPFGNPDFAAATNAGLAVAPAGGNAPSGDGAGDGAAGRTRRRTRR